ncbi:hypothetical protein CP02DC21_2001, partial [Chlamydia psittaci 02DC21]
NRLKPDKNISNRFSPAQTGLIHVLTGTNQARSAQTGFDRLKTGSKRPRLVPTGFDRLKLDQTGSNLTRPTETAFDR